MHGVLMLIDGSNLFVRCRIDNPHRLIALIDDQQLCPTLRPRHTHARNQAKRKPSRHYSCNEWFLHSPEVYPRNLHYHAQKAATAKPIAISFYSFKPCSLLLSNHRQLFLFRLEQPLNPLDLRIGQLLHLIARALFVVG